jgi:hypothetical protein
MEHCPFLFWVIRRAPHVEQLSSLASRPLHPLGHFYFYIQTRLNLLNSTYADGWDRRHWRTAPLTAPIVQLSRAG